MSVKSIGIIGAGPAGSFAAWRLSQAGFQVLLFDPKAPWDKPCGGGLTAPVMEHFPELEALKPLANPHRKVRILDINNHSHELNLASHIQVISRKPMEEFLIRQATQAGAVFSRRKIVDFSMRDQGWKLKDEQGETFEVDFLIGADGCQSLVRRKFCPAWPKTDYIFTISVLLARKTTLPLTFKFFPGLHGYAWIFPGRETTSFGIGGRNDKAQPEQLFAFLEQMIVGEPELREMRLILRDQSRKWLIPALSFSALRGQKVAGENWALIGDASGAVNALTGEGLLYSFMSAGLLAKALSSEQPESYQQNWWAMCKAEILGPSLWEALFFKDWSQRQVNRILARSDTGRELIAGILSGARPKRTQLFGRAFKSWLESFRSPGH